jgi:hypothetical protein
MVKDMTVDAIKEAIAGLADQDSMRSPCGSMSLNTTSEISKWRQIFLLRGVEQL